MTNPKRTRRIWRDNRPATATPAPGQAPSAHRQPPPLGAPAHLRTDNGPELTAAALRHWCRIWDTHTTYIEPGSRCETPFVESVDGRLRDECLNIEDFTNILEAQVILKDWRTEYNNYRPHQSLGRLTSAAYAAHCETHQHQPEHP